jgi:hypothetical protein
VRQPPAVRAKRHLGAFAPIRNRRLAAATTEMRARYAARPDYRAVAFASEPITTDEDRTEAADAALSAIDAQMPLTEKPLKAAFGSAA